MVVAFAYLHSIIKEPFPAKGIASEEFMPKLRANSVIYGGRSVSMKSRSCLARSDY